jgi:hypothetical protein
MRRPAVSAMSARTRQVERRSLEDGANRLGRRILVGIGRTSAVALAAAVAGVLLIAAGSALLTLVLGGDPRSALAFLWFLLPTLLIIPFVVVAAAVPLIGMPVATVLRILEIESAPVYAASGAVAGLFLSMVLNWGAGPLPGEPLALVCSAYGALAAWLFCRIFRRSAGTPPVRGDARSHSRSGS